jgi:hypothetical protein
LGLVYERVNVEANYFIISREMNAVSEAHFLTMKTKVAKPCLHLLVGGDVLEVLGVDVVGVPGGGGGRHREQGLRRGSHHSLHIQN